MNSRIGPTALSIACLLADRFFHVRLQGLVVYVVEGRRHDEEGKKEREADDDLGRRHVLGADGLTDKAENDDDPGKAGGHQQNTRGNREDGEDEENLQGG